MFGGSIFDVANNSLFGDPHNGAVVAEFRPASGRNAWVTLLDVAVPELVGFGDIKTRSPSLFKTVRQSEIATRPTQSDNFAIGDEVWQVKSAEPDSEGLNWRLDLELSRAAS